MIAMTKSPTATDRLKDLADALKRRPTFSLRTRLRLLWKRVTR